MNFVAFVLTRRAPVHVRVLATETGYSRANVYRMLEAMKKHFPVDVNDGLVTVRRVVSEPEA